MTKAETYVTAAYGVVLGIVLLWLVLYAFKMSRLEREVAELVELASARGGEPASEREETPVG